VLIAGWLENELGRPKEELATVALFSALGALSASLMVARFADSARATRIYSWLAIGFGVTLMLFSRAETFSAGLAAIVLVGATSGGFHALNGAVIARETEPAYMGRVMSLTFMAFAGFSLTAWPLGQLADLFGERAVLFWMGAGVLVVATIMSFVVARDVRRPT
jgi:predicted MFS family arabinose efflux permease